MEPAEPVSFLKSPSNRKPRQLTQQEQKWLDDLLRRDGFKAVRGKSIFVLGNSNTIEFEGFGKPYVVIPYDDFAYAWNIHKKYITWWDGGEFQEIFEEKPLSEWDDRYLKVLGFSNTDLFFVLRGDKEIYVTGKYVIIDGESEDGEKILKKLGLWDAYG